MKKVNKMNKDAAADKKLINQAIKKDNVKEKKMVKKMVKKGC